MRDPRKTLPCQPPEQSVIHAKCVHPGTQALYRALQLGRLDYSATGPLEIKNPNPLPHERRRGGD